MILYPKKQSHQAIALFFVLLFLIFIFRFFEVKRNLIEIPAFSYLESESQDFEKGSPEDENKQILSSYEEFEVVSDNENEAISNQLFDKNNSANNSKSDIANTDNEKELPKILSIPKLGINAPVQCVGLNAEDEMAVPSNNSDVAWFSLGTIPGKKGSAVIAGHLNGRSGEPAIFWDLHKLKVGDGLYITDKGGNKKYFQVKAVKEYGTNSAPMEKIFGLKNGTYLNLITCGGLWDRAEDTYDERLVIFTEYLE
ncbi:MAG: class F sortase [Patescibacteria group bacterium]|nr:class F sortase [Patescibacteria group bacterium]